jgi:hypothetical protein
MSVYKLNCDISGGTQNAINQLDVQFDGTIVAVNQNLTVDLDADQEFAHGEVSFLSTNTIYSNDARGTIAEMAAQLNLTTSGGAAGFNHHLSGLSIPVSAGERIFGHVISTAGVTGTYNAILYVDDRADVNLRRRR